MIRFFTATALCCVTLLSFSQKKIIDSKSYSEWKVISSSEIAKNGNYFTFTAEPYEGNKTAYILDLTNNTDTLLKLERGHSVKFNRASTFATATLSADYKKVRSLKIKETKAHKMPKDTLVIFDVTTKTKTIIPNVGKYALLDSVNRIVGMLTHNYPLKKKELSKGQEKQLKEGYDGDRKVFFVANAQGEILFQEKDVTTYFVDEEQQTVVLIKQDNKKDKTFYYAIRLSLSSFKEVELQERFEKIESMYISSKENTQFLIGKLFEAKQTRNEWYRISTGFTEIYPLCILDKMDTNYVVSTTSKFQKIASTDLWQVEFQHYEPKKGKDTLLKEEQVKLDVWSWKDNLIQPKQLKEAKNYYQQKFAATVSFDELGLIKNIQLLEDDTLRLQKAYKESTVTLATSSFAYNATISYAYPWKEDVYWMDVKTGNKKILQKGIFSKTLLTPDGNLFYYQKERDTNLYVRSLQTEIENCLTCGIQERWKEDLNGMDFLPSFAGQMVVDENKKDLWFNSTKGLYKYDVSKNEVNLITPKEWLNRKIELNFYKIELDSTFFNPSNIIVEVFDLSNKWNYYYTIDKNNSLTEIVSGYFKASHFTKAKNTFLARIQTNENYPDFYIIEKGTTKQITDVNPQQKLYNWSTVEPIKWTAYDGQELEGLLYRPENYDSTKKYPLIVYYYETSSEDIHRYVAPRPTASIIFSTEYASSGYFVFMPDIRYKIGHPAKGAYNAIMSGTDYVLKKYSSIDSTRMGLQGQSWGGYQTAQMITMTTRYAAAMAGAPVSNMFSAYGGIRWGSGLSRQFQYEHSQSRIGKTIWEAPELYTENSPIFGLPKVKTPLLIMHNDEDGAVPWYQGIELFMGLNRLQKPVWLFNYNGDDHNLMKKGNRKDLSVRMKQFFDFYLNKGQEPDWMKNGRSAMEK